MTSSRIENRCTFLAAVAAMATVVLASNILVQYPISIGGREDLLTWGAFSYPFGFLVTDLANRRFGPRGARRVVYVGFLAAVILSVAFATPRIAIASGSAFLVAQLLDIAIFDRLRERAWWLPPFVSSIVSSGLDTAIFFSVAFSCAPVPGLGLTISEILGSLGISDTCVVIPWINLALADFGVKLAIAALAILPYGAFVAARPAMR
jgi:queuosine precursor transporter